MSEKTKADDVETLRKENEALKLAAAAAAVQEEDVRWRMAAGLTREQATAASRAQAENDRLRK